MVVVLAVGTLIADDGVIVVRLSVPLSFMMTLSLTFESVITMMVAIACASRMSPVGIMRQSETT